MEAITFDKILILTIFFVPGFVYLKAYRLFFAEIRTDFSKDLYEAIGFSFLNALIFAYPLYFIHLDKFIDKHTGWYFLIMFLVIIIAPIIYAMVFYKITKFKWYSKFLINPTKRAWDSFFSRRESYYVIVTLKNGKRIGGKYGLNSYSSTYPNPEGIYLEEVWKLNDEYGFDEIVDQTEGILITENEISTIEFYI
jgi:hypothetical protein